MSRWLFYSILVAAVAMGCGEEEEAGEALGPADIQGTWVGSCQAVEETYGQNSVVFFDRTFTFSSTAYSDAECTTVDNVVKGEGTYELGGVEKDASETYLTAINYTFASIEWEFVADPSNAVDYAVACGGEADSGTVDILGLTCTLNETYAYTFPSPAYGTIWKDSDKLYTSEFVSNGATAEDRSENIDKEAGALDLLSDL